MADAPSARPANHGDMINLADHFNRLHDRTRFFVLGAENCASESNDPNVIMRASMDLLEYFEEFDEFIKLAIAGAPVPNELGEHDGGAGEQFPHPVK